MAETNDSFRYIGKGVTRRDGVEKVTGSALFTYDLVLQGMLYAKTVRSPHAYARIKAIDTREAEKLPGVRAVVTGKELSYKVGLYVLDKDVLAFLKIFLYPDDHLFPEQRFVIFLQILFDAEHLFIIIQIFSKILNVQEGISLKTDINKGGLHARKNLGHTPPIDGSQDSTISISFYENLIEITVFENASPGFP